MLNINVYKEFLKGIFIKVTKLFYTRKRIILLSGIVCFFGLILVWSSNLVYYLPIELITAEEIPILIRQILKTMQEIQRLTGSAGKCAKVPQEENSDYEDLIRFMLDLLFAYEVGCLPCSAIFRLIFIRIIFRSFF
jgi:hypothetical protein